PWARLTRVRDLSLVVEAEGSLRLRVMRAAPGQPAQVLKEQSIEAPQRSRVVMPLGSPLDMPTASRLFWHVDAVDGGQLHEAAWCTRTPGAVRQRMAVLVRTFGRADDVRALLLRLADAAADDAFHARVLAAMDFWVLDTSPAQDPAWQAMAALGLNLRVWVGPNLGGGGNAAHLAKLFLDEQDAGADEVAEVLILDDDLGISMETLARYAVFCSYRSADLVCSLPVLMKSRPATVWEDGGLWGRPGLHDGNPGSENGVGAAPRRGFGPRLIRHGVSVESFEHLDDFGPLNECEYSTFIFFGLPTRALRKLGYPAALFLRGDDIELSLRARAAGLPLVTNPNLAAWHEPGHSYAQEYMAVLHGVLINLAYSSNEAHDYSRFFEQRMTEHAALDDLEGLALYLAVLDDLLDPASPLLTVNFAAHYRSVMQRLGSIAMSPLPDTERERLAQQAAAEGGLVLPFIYPGYHPPATGTDIAADSTPRSVLLFNPGAKTGRIVAHAMPQRRLALQRRYLEALARWHTEFEPLRARWQMRLKASTSPAFWQQLQQQHAGATREVLASRCKPLPLQDAGPETAAVLPHEQGAVPQEASGTQGPTAARPQSLQPIRELRDRLERELVRWTQLRLSAERSERAVPGGRRRGRPWWRALWTQPPPPLPLDFDPATYLALNADVARTGIDPVKHYLSFGRQEGRRYRL
ncbi:MAG TPA: hypothetical protein VLA16_13030, partial [Ideonella sp.]|nr:hypothetical protein [Ideonella sp.]